MQMDEQAQAVNHANPAWWAQRAARADAAAQAAERQMDLVLEWFKKYHDLSQDHPRRTYQTMMNVSAFIQQVRDQTGVQI